MTDETEHTSGPWRVEGDGYDTATYVMANDVMVKGGKEGRIIAVCHSYNRQDRISRLANAHLIAAAPELLEALKSIMPHGLAMDDDAMDHMPGVKAARLAIAKAEGRSK